MSFGIAESGQQSAINGPAGDLIAVQPTITWTTAVPGGSYHLWVNQVGGMSGIINQRDLTTASFTPSTDLDTGPYIAWIRQVSGSGVPLAWSSAFRFEIGASTKPAQPVLNVTQLNGVQTFSWPAVAHAAGYELWVNLGTSRVLHETELTSLSYAASDLQTGVYRAWVRGYSSLGVAGPWSEVVGFEV